MYIVKLLGEEDIKMKKENSYEILDRISDGFYALDTEWNFTYFNKEASRLLLRNKEQLIGKNVWIEFPETKTLPLYQNYHKALREQSPVIFDMYYPPLKVWFNIRAFPSSNGLTVYFQDITLAQKISSKREQHYKSLFENNPDAVFSFDLDGNYLSINPAMEELLGYSKEELLTMSFEPLIVKEDLMETKDYFKHATNGENQHYETRAYHRSGRIIDLKVTNIPIIVEGRIVGVYGIAKDVSKEKRTEKLLYESEKLTAVGQLAASIAHEIRNPLTSIKGFLQLIKSLNTVADVKDNYLQIMSDEITRIENITSELLVLAKPQKQDFHYKNVKSIIENVVILLRSQALMNKVDVNYFVEAPHPIRCIENQLKQVFINIIKNAIESMPAGGKIKITAKPFNTNTIQIKIVDEGCGIPEQFLKKIGTPFYTTKEKGTGLGLMTTVKIVQSHEGELEITSRVNEGTTIDIYLPYSNETT